MPKKKNINEEKISSEKIAEETDTEITEENVAEGENPEVTDEVNQKALKTVTIKILPQYDTEGKPSLALPVTLIEPFLGKTVELMPTAVVTEAFANQLLANYSYYEIVPDDGEVDISNYKIRASYRLEEMSELFKRLSFTDRDKVIEFTKKLNAADNIGEG